MAQRKAGQVESLAMTLSEPRAEFDIGAVRRSFVAVSRFRNKFAALFAAVWLLATLHCGLETVGVLELHAGVDQACCVGGEEHCTHDGCEIVEGSGYTPGVAAKISMPQLAVCFCLICPDVSLAAVETVAGCSSYFERPFDWVPTWQFVQRAALLPGAPWLILA